MEIAFDEWNPENVDRRFRWALISTKVDLHFLVCVVFYYVLLYLVNVLPDVNYLHSHTCSAKLPLLCVESWLSLTHESSISRLFRFAAFRQLNSCSSGLRDSSKMLLSWSFPSWRKWTVWELMKHLKTIVPHLFLEYYCWMKCL